MGDVPQWYRVLKAAQYLGCPPWEMEDVPWTYVRQAEAAQEAEAHAQSVKQKQAAKQVPH